MTKMTKSNDRHSLNGSGKKPKQRYTSFASGVATLEKSLGYHFNDDNLAQLAVTHRSYDSQHNYERLEFLGDALLGMIIGEALYYQYPQQKEGRLSRMRATLVRQETLVLVAQDLGLSSHLILGVGERKGGGLQRASILADVVESLIGAIYLDSQDMQVVKTCVLHWFDEQINKVDDSLVLKDAKSRLQEWLQAKQYPLPTYDLIETSGNAPNQVFKVRCHVAVPNTQDMTQSGPSRRIAEQKAAELMINQLHR